VEGASVEGVVIGHAGAWTQVDFQKCDTALPKKISIKARDLTTLDEQTALNPTQASIVTADDRRNMVTITEALLSDDVDLDDEDATPEDYGVDTHDDSTTGAWRPETDIKCYRTEDMNPAIKGGSLRTRYIAGTCTVLTYLIIFCPRATLRSACLILTNR
jgi:hypothetical protein